eukprot:TRINITY_DN8961_c0_g1_i1.p1 TRINITY_DN8961_c0_g1~~TRINITY_DN8961_c0_g1_i1.p1  ORF type:complete len:268 (+),score=24.42 TRINITY_DN8961_c0_g1_i1:213-1016(+)
MKSGSRGVLSGHVVFQFRLISFWFISFILMVQRPLLDELSRSSPPAPSNAGSLFIATRNIYVRERHLSTTNGRILFLANRSNGPRYRQFWEFPVLGLLEAALPVWRRSPPISCRSALCLCQHRYQFKKLPSSFQVVIWLRMRSVIAFLLVAASISSVVLVAASSNSGQKYHVLPCGQGMIIRDLVVGSSSTCPMPEVVQRPQNPRGRSSAASQARPAWVLSYAEASSNSPRSPTFTMSSCRGRGMITLEVGRCTAALGGYYALVKAQ